MIMEVARLIRLYRERQGLTQKEFVDEVKGICPELTVPLLSYIERSVVPAPEGVKDYVAGQFINGKIACQTNENDKEGQFIVEDDFTRISGDLEVRVYLALKNLNEGERITRSDLVRILHTSDRNAREVVERLRSKGIRVCSGMGKPGYFLAGSDEEYRAFEREYLSRAFTAINTAYAMRNSKADQVRLAYE